MKVITLLLFTILLWSSIVLGTTIDVVVSWQDNSNNEDGFRIERKVSNGATYVEVGRVDAGVMTFRDENVPLGTTLFYRVKAFNVAGESGYSNEASIIIPSPPTGAPSGAAATFEIHP